MSRSHALALASCAAFASILLEAGGAAAYVRRTTDTGKPVYWAGSCAWVVPDTSVPPELTATDFEATVAQAVENWQGATTTGASACSYLKIAVNPAAKGEARYDGKNIVKFMQDSWCRPAESGRPEMCFSSNIASITTTLYEPSSGEILDSDIELNSVNFSFLIEPTKVAPREGTIGVDLEGTLTHELGHFQGLDHTCWDHVTSTAPLDQNGHAIPDCNTLQTLPSDQMTAVTDTTMFPFPQPGDITARIPKADDVAGICSVYPLLADPKKCAPPVLPSNDAGSHACSSGAPGTTSGGAGLLLAVTLLGAHIRRRRAASADKV